MKLINFINSLPAHTFKELKQWYIFSRGMMVMVCLCICAMHIMQIRDYYIHSQEEQDAQQKSQSFNKIIEHKQALKKKQQELQQRIVAFKNHKDGMSATLDYLQYLYKSPFYPSIKTVNTTHDQGIEINGQCFTIAELMKNHHQLAQVPFFNNLKIVSLQAENPKIKLGVNFTIKGFVQSNDDKLLQSIQKI